MSRSRALLIVLLSAPIAAPVTAQEAPREYSRFTPSLALINTQALGELGTGPGIGAAMTLALAVDPARRIRARLDFRPALYGSESRDGCLMVGGVGCVGDVEVETTYASLYIGAGPELALPIGTSELVVAGTAGLGGFSVGTSVQSDYMDETLATSDDFEDWFFAWSLGGELRIPIWSNGSLLLGAHYQHNGEATYVPEGGVVRDPDEQTVTISPVTSDANQMVIALGLAFRPYRGWEPWKDAPPGK